MLWVDQQYHDAILDYQKETNSLKQMTEDPPLQNTYKAFAVINPAQTEAPIMLSDLYPGSLYLSVEF